MSYFSPSHKYAPGLGEPTNGTIQKILVQWKKAGIGVAKERKSKHG